MSRKGIKIVNARFLRRIIITICVLVFLVACVVVTGFMTAIRNVNIVYADSTGRYEDAFNDTFVELENLKGKNLIFLKEKKISECIVDSSRIRLASYEKTYPCSVDVILEERIETFTSYDESSNLRTIYDSYGDAMETRSNDMSILGDDGTPDIEISSSLTSEERIFIADVLSLFGSRFDAARRLVSRMDLDVDTLYIGLRSGLWIVIADVFNDDGQHTLEAKLNSVYNVYSSLSDSEKISGMIQCDENSRSLYVA